MPISNDNLAVGCDKANRVGQYIHVVPQAIRKLRGGQQTEGFTACQGFHPLTRDCEVCAQRGQRVDLSRRQYQDVGAKAVG